MPSGPRRRSPVPPTQGTTDWAGVADWYDGVVGEAGSAYHRELIFPAVLRLLRPEPNDRALDVACGQGALCRLLAERGARVLGVDSAGPLLDLARGHGGAEPRDERPTGRAPEKTGVARYERHDARELTAIAEGGFDLAACVLALQNVHPIAPVFTGVARALRKGGRFALVLNHPAFRGPKETSWGWEGTDAQYRRVDRYLVPRKHPIVAHPGSGAASAYTWTFHRPLQDYVTALGKAGLPVDALEELASHKTSQPGPRAAAENKARKEIPLFMVLRATKV